MKLCPQCESGYHDSHTTCPTHGGVLNEIRDLRPGMLIHKTYRIVRRLGRGGMGTVYLADHVFMHEQRALKFLAPELCEDAEFTERFRREVWTLKQIRHRNVIHCGDLEPAEDDSLFFAMEYVDGPDLREFLKHASKPMERKMALAIARGIAEGLGAAHALGMVHRDIKPENILMTKHDNEWRPKIADFGIVATRESTGHRTRTGGTLLTMQYAAPEQWRGMRSTELDGRTDLYALGCVMYEMLTGQPPFEAETYEEWAEKHKNALPIAPSQLRPELANSPGLDLLLWRMLAKDRDHRPTDAAEVIAAIDAIASGRPAVHLPRYPTVVEPPQFAPFVQPVNPPQPRVNSGSGQATPAGQISTDPLSADLRRSSSGRRSEPPPFGRTPVNSGLREIPQIWGPRDEGASRAIGAPPPIPDWYQAKLAQAEERRRQPLATFLLGNLGFSGQLVFAAFLGLNTLLQLINAVRLMNAINILTYGVIGAGSAVCLAALALRWKRVLPVKWLGAAGWFAIAMVEAFLAAGSLWVLGSRYGISATMIRFGGAWGGSLCVAGAALWFGLSEITEEGLYSGTNALRPLVPVSRIGFVVLLLWLGVLDILRMLPSNGYIAPAPRFMVTALGVVETLLAVLLLVKFKPKLAAIALAAVHVLLVPMNLIGSLQALRMMPLLMATVPTFMLALAGGVLALADVAPSGTSLDTPRHVP